MKLIINLGIMMCILSFIFGCSSFCYQSPRYVKLAHEITEKTAKRSLHEETYEEALKLVEK